jgi:hypothetical protein
LITGETDKTTEVRNQILLSIMDRTSRQKLNKESEDLNNILDQRNLADTYRTSHPTAIECTFFFKDTYNSLHN